MKETHPLFIIERYPRRHVLQEGQAFAWHASQFWYQLFGKSTKHFMHILASPLHLLTDHNPSMVHRNKIYK